MRATLLAAALLVSGAASAQSWERFIGSNPWFPNALPADHGLATDRLGHVFVEALNAPFDTTEFAHFYSLDATGNHAWMWGLIGSNMQPTFESRAFSARDGYRVAWFERTGNWSGNNEDTLYGFAPNDAQPRWEHRIERDADRGVIAVAADGNDGVVVIRRSPNFGGIAYAVEALGGFGSVRWTQFAPGCAFTIDEFLEMRITGDFDPTVELLSRCAGSNGQSDELVITRTRLADGGTIAQQRFALPPFSPTLSRHSVSAAGRWVFAAAAPWGMQLFTVGPNDSWPQWIPPAPNLADDVGIIATGAGQMITSTDASGATMLRFVDEFATWSDWIETPVLTTPTPNLHWFADAGNHPVVAFVAEASGERFVHMLGFDETGGVAWKRNIYGVPPGAEPQFASAANGEVVLAVDRVDTDGTHGIHVEQFAVGTATSGPGGCQDGFCWK